MHYILRVAYRSGWTHNGIYLSERDLLTDLADRLVDARDNNDNVTSWTVLPIHGTATS